MAADPRIALGDHDAHAAVALGARRRLRQVALAVLVVVEVLLPEVAELEDPVLALRRPELDDEGLRGGLAPGAEGEVAVRDAAIAQVGRPREAQLVGARREVLLPPGAHELGVGEHDLARLREAHAELRGLERARLRAVEALDRELRLLLARAIEVDDADQEADAVGLEGQPVPGALALGDDHLEASVGLEADPLARQEGGGAERRRVEVLEARDAPRRPVARADVGGLRGAPRGDHEVGDAAAAAADPVLAAPVDELGEQVVLVRALHVDALPPGRVSQPRPLGLAVLDEALEPVAHDARQEAVPLGPVELGRLVAEALDRAAGLAQRLAAVVPGAARQQALLRGVGHGASRRSRRAASRRRAELIEAARARAPRPCAAARPSSSRGPGRRAAAGASCRPARCRAPARSPRSVARGP